MLEQTGAASASPRGGTAAPHPKACLPVVAAEIGERGHELGHEGEEEHHVAYAELTRHHAAHAHHQAWAAAGGA